MDITLEIVEVAIPTTYDEIEFTHNDITINMSRDFKFTILDLHNFLCGKITLTFKSKCFPIPQYRGIVQIRNVDFCKHKDTCVKHVLSSKYIGKTEYYDFNGMETIGHIVYNYSVVNNDTNTAHKPREGLVYSILEVFMNHKKSQLLFNLSKTCNEILFGTHKCKFNFFLGIVQIEKYLSQVHCKYTKSVDYEGIHKLKKLKIKKNKLNVVMKESSLEAFVLGNMYTYEFTSTTSDIAVSKEPSNTTKMHDYDCTEQKIKEYDANLVHSLNNIGMFSFIYNLVNKKQESDNIASSNTINVDNGCCVNNNDMNVMQESTTANTNSVGNGECTTLDVTSNSAGVADDRSDESYTNKVGAEVISNDVHSNTCKAVFDRQENVDMKTEYVTGNTMYDSLNKTKPEKIYDSTVCNASSTFNTGVRDNTPEHNKNTSIGNAINKTCTERTRGGINDQSGVTHQANPIKWFINGQYVDITTILEEPDMKYKLEDFLSNENYVISHKILLSKLTNLLYYCIAAYGNTWPNIFCTKRRNIKDTKMDPFRKAVLEYLDMENSSLLSISYGLEDVPDHIIFFEKQHNRIVVSIKGTSSSEEALKDFDCLYAKFLHGFAHKGMSALANLFVEKITEQLKKYVKKCKASSILLTGHSLGGSISILVHLIYKQKNMLQNIKVTTVAFCPAPVVSYSIAKDKYPDIFVINYGNDAVPRINYGSFTHFKYLASSIGSTTQYFSTGDVKKNIEQVLANMPSKTACSKLYFPGNLYHFKRVNMKRDKDHLSIILYKKVDIQYYEMLYIVKHSTLHHMHAHILNVFTKGQFDHDEIDDDCT